MLAKKFRLRKRTEFAYSYKHGTSFYNDILTLVVFKRKDSLLRIGFSVSKKIGKAVIRNKVKRQLQAVIGENVLKITKGYNLIFIAREKIKAYSFERIKENTNKLLKLRKLL